MGPRQSQWRHSPASIRQMPQAIQPPHRGPVILRPPPRKRPPAAQGKVVRLINRLAPQDGGHVSGLASPGITSSVSVIRLRGQVALGIAGPLSSTCGPACSASSITRPVRLLPTWPATRIMRRPTGSLIGVPTIDCGLSRLAGFEPST